MKKQFKKIIKALYKFGLLSNITLTDGLLTCKYLHYTILCKWVKGKPYAQFEIWHSDTRQVFDYVYPEYYRMDYFDRIYHNCLLSQTTDNPDYINRMLRKLIFGDIEN